MENNTQAIITNVKDGNITQAHYLHVYIISLRTFLTRRIISKATPLSAPIQCSLIMGVIPFYARDGSFIPSPTFKRRIRKMYQRETVYFNGFILSGNIFAENIFLRKCKKKCISK